MYKYEKFNSQVVAPLYRSHRPTGSSGSSIRVVAAVARGVAVLIQVVTVLVAVAERERREDGQSVSVALRTSRNPDQQNPTGYGNFRRLARKLTGIV